eukprot:226994-Pyramimonas_sp.AAC.1
MRGARWNGGDLGGWSFPRSCACVSHLSAHVPAPIPRCTDRPRIEPDREGRGARRWQAQRGRPFC